MKCNVQCRYVFKVKPSRALVREALQTFIRTGKSPTFAEVQPVCWSGHDPERIQACLRSAGQKSACPGVVGYYARPELVLLDFDNEEPVDLIRVRRTLTTLGLKVRALEYAKTRRGWHVVLLLAQGLQPAETVALQAILGSDPGRETFNLARILGGKAEKSYRWNLLFDYKLR